MQADLASGRLRQVLEPYTTAPFGIYAIFAERGKPTSAARTLVDHIARTLRDAGLDR